MGGGGGATSFLISKEDGRGGSGITSNFDFTPSGGMTCHSLYKKMRAIMRYYYQTKGVLLFRHDFLAYPVSGRMNISDISSKNIGCSKSESYKK